MQLIDYLSGLASAIMSSNSNNVIIYVHSQTNLIFWIVIKIRSISATERGGSNLLLEIK